MLGANVSPARLDADPRMRMQSVGRPSATRVWERLREQGRATYDARRPLQLWRNHVTTPNELVYTAGVGRPDAQGILRWCQRQGSLVSIPLVSIIITNFNYARYLPQSIDSALSQTHPKTEVVVVDDASVDNSRDIIREYGSRIIAVLRERNGGHGAAFNAGFTAIGGDIVVFLDADDYLYPGAVARGALEKILPVPEAEFRMGAEGYLVTLAPFYGPVVSLDEPLGVYRQHGANAW